MFIVLRDGTGYLQAVLSGQCVRYFFSYTSNRNIIFLCFSPLSIYLRSFFVMGSIRLNIYIYIYIFMI